MVFRERRCGCGAAGEQYVRLAECVLRELRFTGRHLPFLNAPNFPRLDGMLGSMYCPNQQAPAQR